MSPYTVIFKDEGNCDGEPFGPVLVIKDYNPDPTILGRPFQPKCFCDHQQVGERNEWGYPVCESCGGEVEQWVTLSQAKAIAQEFDTMLKED